MYIINVLRLKKYSVFYISNAELDKVTWTTGCRVK